MFNTQTLQNQKYDVINGKNGSDLVKNQLKTLENLDLIQLVKKSQYSKVLSSMAADVFKRKFASKIITFNSGSEKSIHEAVLICDYKTLTLTLQQFGHLIEKIEISYDDIEVDQHKGISELLLKHCSDSLLSMEIIQWETNALWNFENPFKNVNNLTIHGDPKLKSPKLFHIFSKKPMKLNEIFPNIR